MQQKIFSLLTKGENERKTKLSVDVSGLEDFVKAMDGLDKDWNNTKINKRIKVIGRTMSDCSEQAIQYAHTMTSSADGIDAYVRSQTLANVVGKKFIGVLKGIGAAMMDSLITFAATAALNYVAGQIIDIINREKDLREAATESSNALNDGNQTIDGYISKITTLKESLDSGTLSEQEAYEARKQLVDIQGELIDKYGEEVQGVDLLNGSLQTQIDLLNQMKSNDMRTWLSENAEAIDNAQNRMDESNNYLVQHLGTVNTTDYDELSKIAAKYGDKGVTFGASTGGYEFKLTADMSDAKDVLAELQTDITDSQVLSENTKSILERSIGISSQNVQADLDTNKGLVEQAAYYQTQTNEHYKKLYEDLESANKTYAEAMANGDKTAIKSALGNARDVIAEFNSEAFDQASMSDEDNKYVKQYLTTLTDQLEESTKQSFAQQALNDGLLKTVPKRRTVRCKMQCLRRVRL